MLPTLEAQAGPAGNAIVLVIAVIALAALGACIILARHFNLWIQGRLTGADVGLLELVGMSYRKVDSNVVVRSKIMAHQGGLAGMDGLSTRSLETHYLAGGNVPAVVRALIAARQAEIPLSFAQAAAIDLAGRDVLEEVKAAIDRQGGPSPGDTRDG